jgi:hypothetical protein
VRTIDVTPDTIYAQLLPMVTADTNLDDLRTLSKLFHEDFLKSHPDGQFHTRCKPSSEIRPAVRQRRKRQAKSLVQHIESLGKPLSEAPIGETEKQSRVRAIKDMLKRCKLSDDAGLRYLTPGTGYDDTWNLQRWLEAELADAERDVKFERGDY